MPPHHHFLFWTKAAKRKYSWMLKPDKCSKCKNEPSNAPCCQLHLPTDNKTIYEWWVTFECHWTFSDCHTQPWRVVWAWTVHAGVAWEFMTYNFKILKNYFKFTWAVEHVFTNFKMPSNFKNNILCDELWHEIGKLPSLANLETKLKSEESSIILYFPECCLKTAITEVNSKLTLTISVNKGKR